MESGRKATSVSRVFEIDCQESFDQIIKKPIHVQSFFVFN